MLILKKGKLVEVINVDNEEVKTGIVKGYQIGRGYLIDYGNESAWISSTFVFPLYDAGTRALHPVYGAGVVRRHISNGLVLMEFYNQWAVVCTKDLDPVEELQGPVIRTASGNRYTASIAMERFLRGA